MNDPEVKVLMLKGDKGDGLSDDDMSRVKSQIDANSKVLNSRIDNLILSSGSESSAEVTDARTGYDGATYATLGTAIRSQASALKEDITNIAYTNNLLEKGVYVENYYYNTPHDSSTNSDYYDSFKNIPVTANTIYKISHTARLIACFDSSGTWLETKQNVHEHFTVSKDGFVHIAFRKYMIPNVKMSTVDLNYLPPYKKLFLNNSVILKNENKVVSKRKTNNLINCANSVDGYISSDGKITDSDVYKTSELIKVEPKKSYLITPGICKLLPYNGKKEVNGSAFIDGNYSNYVFDAQDTQEFIRVTYPAKYDYIMNITETTKQASNEFYGEVLEDNLYLNQSNTENVLHGKLYVACGDSFTEGDFRGSSDSYTFEDGLYKGKNKVYPFYIGRRNHMYVLNEAISGSTITNINNNSFSVNRYKNIPNNVDYITMKFGINDMHNNVPLGTIDDDVNTTFYGAWNTVLEYIITKHPYAKIGIIIGHGLDDESGQSYANAMREVAKKWGIPYLDEDNDEQVPLLNRTNKEYVCDKAKQLRKNAFVVNSSNQHPNAKSHEYESTFIEAFMRRL